MAVLCLYINTHLVFKKKKKNRNNYWRASWCRNGCNEIGDCFLSCGDVADLWFQFALSLFKQELRFRLVFTRFSRCRLLQNQTLTTSFSRWRPLAIRAISWEDGLLFSTKLCSSASLAPRLQRQGQDKDHTNLVLYEMHNVSPRPDTWWLFSFSFSARSFQFYHCTKLQREQKCVGLCAFQLGKIAVNGKIRTQFDLNRRWNIFLLH